jgi:hypothetical protein
MRDVIYNPDDAIPVLREVHYAGVRWLMRVLTKGMMLGEDRNYYQMPLHLSEDEKADIRSMREALAPWRKKRGLTSKGRKTAKHRQEDSK